jgi:hypothetical protein
MHESDMVDLKAIVAIITEKDKLESNPFNLIPSESLQEALIIVNDSINSLSD